MRYFKILQDGYIRAIGQGAGGEELTEAEYSTFLENIHNKPAAPDGYGYRFTDANEWELYELPIVEDDDPEVTEAEALEIILGGAT